MNGLISRRAVTRFNSGDMDDQERLFRSLNEFSLDISRQLAELQGLARVAVLDDVLFETGATVAVNTAPFPLRVQTPFAVAGAWIVLCEDVKTGEAGITGSAYGLVGRPVSGGADSDNANALEIQFITGLAKNTQYRARVAVVGVKNG